MAVSYLISLQGFFAVLVLILLIQLCLILWKAFYNLFLHPLRKLPGPWLWIAFPLSKSLAQLRGNLDIAIRSHHQKYGPVVRIGPNEVTFTSGQAWKDIYGHGHAELPKNFPKRIGAAGRAANIINANARDHFRFRRAMLPAFSDRALDQQETIIMGYVDLLIEKLGKVADSAEPTDMVKWYTYTTFDLIGDLAYGTNFDGLKEGKPNKWISNIDNMMRLFPIMLLASSSLILSKLVMIFASDKIKQSRQQHIKMTTDLAMTRIKNKDMERRGDFMDFMMRAEGKEHGMTHAELAATSDTLIVAGSETTATLLSGVTYHLLCRPDALQRCVEEVRSAFDSDSEITFKSASAKLPYMLACLDEGLRIFPPVPTVLMRQTLPGQVTQVDGFDIPPNTSVGVHHLSTYHSELNFHEPRSFRPERWLPESLTDPSSPYYKDRRDAFKPFSTGPRDCIGRNLAYHEMRLILAKVLWNFDLRLTESCRGWAETQKTFALWKKPPLMVEIRERRKSKVLSEYKY